MAADSLSASGCFHSGDGAQLGGHGGGYHPDEEHLPDSLIIHKVNAHHVQTFSQKLANHFLTGIIELIELNSNQEQDLRLKFIALTGLLIRMRNRMMHGHLIPLGQPGAGHTNHLIFLQTHGRRLLSRVLSQSLGGMCKGDLNLWTSMQTGESWMKDWQLFVFPFWFTRLESSGVEAVDLRKENT